MQITINLLDYFKEEYGKSAKKLNLKNVSTIEDILNLLEIEENIECIVLKNGRLSNRGSRIKNNDTLTIFPIIDGG